MAAQRHSGQFGSLTGDPLDVLVVGAGPAGLALALQVRAHGGRVRVVERRPAVFRPSRALIVHPRTLETLHRLGLTNAVLARAIRSPAIQVRLPHRDVTVRLDSFAAAVNRFPHPVLLRQSDLEAVLAEALAQRGVSVERGVALLDFVQDARVVTASLSGATGGDEEVVCRYLAGCDGATSTVRTIAGVGWSGRAYRSEVVLADVELRGSVAPGAAQVAVLGPGLVFLFPLGEGAPWRLMATRASPASDQPLGAFGPPVARAELDQLLAASGLQARIGEVAWSARVRLPHRLADRFRTGRVFLAGDAAHAHSPAGGQGMNTGIQDAANLGWKLAFASRAGDAASEMVLASYEQERRPVARSVLALTRLLFWGEAGTGRVPTLLRGVGAPLVGPLVPWLLRRRRLGAAALWVLDQRWVGYRASPLSMETGSGGRRGRRAGAPLPDQEVRCGPHRVRLLDLTAAPGVHALLSRDAPELASGSLSPWLRVHRIFDWPGSGIVLVRPDGYIGFRSSSLNHDEVADWLARIAAGLIRVPSTAPRRTRRP